VVVARHGDLADARWGKLARSSSSRAADAVDEARLALSGWSSRVRRAALRVWEPRLEPATSGVTVRMGRESAKVSAVSAALLSHSCGRDWSARVRGF